MAGAFTVITAAMIVVQGGSSRPDGPPNVKCGSYCLYIALQAMGLAPPSYQELEDSLGPVGDLGYSMLQLSEEARKRGAHPVAVKTSLANLLARDQPFACICLIKKNHFVILQRIAEDSGKVEIIDPLDAYDLPIDTFSALWNGDALLIGREPLVSEERLNRGWNPGWLWGFALLISAGLAVATFVVLRRSRLRTRVAGLTVILITLSVSNGCGIGLEVGQVVPHAARAPGLVVEPSEHRLGTAPLLRPGETRVIETTLRNEGTVPIAIRKIQQSCGCTMVSLDSDQIAPGSRVVLKTRIALGIDPETRRSVVTLETTDPARPLVPINFEWQVVNPLSSTCALFRSLFS